MDQVTVFAPATVANLGPGFDILGLAVDGLGDVVTARKLDSEAVIIESVTGDDGRLPRQADQNTAGIAATEALKIIGIKTGVALNLKKGLPLGSGLGSSAASAAAAVWAVATLHGFTDKIALLPACLAAEASVSGYHADNVAPALLGGLIFIKSYEPLQIESLPVPEPLIIVLVTPDYEVPTAEARRVVPKAVPMKDVMANISHLGGLITASYRQDATAFGQAIIDEIIEPARAHLIPGFPQVKQAALKMGSLGCSISGAGPTIFAITTVRAAGEAIGQAMQQAFHEVGLSATIQVTTIDKQGARQMPDGIT